MKHFGFALFLFLLLATAVVYADTGRVSLDVKLDPDTRTISGTEELSFTLTGPRVYFLLLGNLDREKNPFLNDRAIDTRYKFGFEPASTTIDAVEAIQSEGTVTLGFHLLALPPALQTYSLRETILVVELPQTGTAVALRIHFTTQVPRLTTGDQEIDQGILTWRFGWYPLLLPRQGEWVEEDGALRSKSGEAFRLEIPAFDYSARIGLPQGSVLACGTDHVEKIKASEPSDKGEDTFVRYRVWNDTPTRTLALTAGPDYERFSLDELPVPIEVLFLPGHEETARLFATYAQDILKDYQKRFGSYPRARLTIVENPNRNGLSMAADGVVWLSSLFFTHRNVTLPGILNRYCEFVLAHEIAHQWWGIGVGVDLNAENWLSEGLAQYAAVSYFEERYGEFGPNVFELPGKGILENLIRSQFGFLNLREHQIELAYIMNLEQGFDEALVKPLSAVEYENADIVRLYDKGYLVMREIETCLEGQDKFDSALRTMADGYMHGQVSVAEFAGLLGKASGKDLDSLFETWVYGNGTADYGVKILSRRRTDDGYKTKVALSRDGGIPQPVVVAATLQDGSTVEETWDGEKPQATLNFTTEKPVSRVTIDPDHLIPDRDRLNNNAPVKFVTITDKNAFPLDAYLVRPDPFSKGVTITYLDRLRLSLGEAAASAEVFKGRNHHLFLDAKIEEGDLAGSIGYTFTTFAGAQIGSPGTFWEPATSITLCAYRLVPQEGPLFYLHLGVREHPSIQHSWSSSVAVDITPSGAGRASITAFDEIRLFPRVYLQGNLTFGAGFGEVPRPLLFDLEELLSFGQMIKGRWVPTPFLGSHKLYGRLAIEFPSSTEEPFNLANLMMVDRTRGRAFLACGASWKSLDEFGKTTPNIEVGAEALFDLSAIGGLLSVKAVVGYATPVLGKGIGVFYFGFSLL